MSDKKYTLLFDAQGAPLGVHINAAMWEEIQSSVLPLLQDACGETEACEPPMPEPMSDWEDLVAYWDLPYPLELSVICDECGESTDNWQEDDPRKFRLKSANFGGMASFECQECHARVIKRHFKDGTQFETVPFAG